MYLLINYSSKCRLIVFSLLKSSPFEEFCIDRNNRKSEVAVLGKYCGWDNTSQPYCNNFDGFVKVWFGIIMMKYDIFTIHQYFRAVKKNLKLSRQFLRCALKYYFSNDHRQFNVLKEKVPFLFKVSYIVTKTVPDFLPNPLYFVDESLLKSKLNKRNSAVKYSL